MEQKIAYTSACDVANLVDQIQKITLEMNEKGYELTFVTYQSDEGKAHMRSTAILVFNKK